MMDQERIRWLVRSLIGNGSKSPDPEQAAREAVERAFAKLPKDAFRIPEDAA